MRLAASRLVKKLAKVEREAVDVGVGKAFRLVDIAAVAQSASMECAVLLHFCSPTLFRFIMGDSRFRERKPLCSSAHTCTRLAPLDRALLRGGGMIGAHVSLCLSHKSHTLMS